MIYVDVHGHMVADSLEELHEFASEVMGLKRHFYEGVRKGHPHYDLTTSNKRIGALIHGAKPVSPKEIVRISRRMK